MKHLTEKKLLDNYVGISNGGHLISDIGRRRYYWNYRNNGCICDRYNADEISVEEPINLYFKDIKNSDKWKNHTNSKQIRQDWKELFPVDTY